MYSAEQLEPLIDRLYEASIQPAVWPRFLAELAHKVNGMMPTLFLHDTEKQSGALAISVDWDSSLIGGYHSRRPRRRRVVYERGGSRIDPVARASG